MVLGEAMRHVQFLTHEIGTECNMADAHAGRCPASLQNRYAELDMSIPITDEAIVDDVERAVAAGFRGMLAWHHYCEALLYMDRIELLASKIARAVPGMRHMLNTNGSLIDAGVAKERLALFDYVIVSNYLGRDWSFLRQIVRRVKVVYVTLDDRMTLGPPSRARCLRPYLEMVIDAYGNLRFCCGDYLGTATKVNVMQHGFDAALAEYLQLRAIAATDLMPENAPAVCLTCQIRCDRLRWTIDGPVRPNVRGVV